MIVLKIGGSLSGTARQLIRDISAGVRHKVVLVVPGGGVFADMVRRLQGVSEDAAHWMAVLGMEQYSYYLADGTDAHLTQTPFDLEMGVNIFLPYRFLWEHDELPHTWNVTSDTIAAWIARKLDAKFIKATDVDGIYLEGRKMDEVHAKKLLGVESCVDPLLPVFLLENRLNCQVVDGRCTRTVLEAISGKRVGTLIIGSD